MLFTEIPGCKQHFLPRSKHSNVAHGYVNGGTSRSVLTATRIGEDIVVDSFIVTFNTKYNCFSLGRNFNVIVYI